MLNPNLAELQDALTLRGRTALGAFLDWRLAKLREGNDANIDSHATALLRGQIMEVKQLKKELVDV